MIKNGINFFINLCLLSNKRRRRTRRRILFGVNSSTVMQRITPRDGRPIAVLQAERLDHRLCVAFTEFDLRIMSEVELPLRIRGVHDETARRNHLAVRNNVGKLIDEGIMPGTASAVEKLARQERNISQPQVRFEVINELFHLVWPITLAVIRLALVEEDTVDGRSRLLCRLRAIDDPAVFGAAVLHKGLDLLSADGARDESDGIVRRIPAYNGLREPVTRAYRSLIALVEGRNGYPPDAFLAAGRRAAVVSKHKNT